MNNRYQESHSQWEIYGPFGAGGHEVGVYALSLLDSLSDRKASAQTDPSFQWDLSDINAFEDFGELDTGIRFMDLHPDLDGGYVGELHRDFQRLFAAMPLTEGERHWLYEPFGRNMTRGPKRFAASSTEIMEAGVRREVRGQDIVRRWWSWRRECDEFAGEGSLDEARSTLGVIATKLVQSEHWPMDYSVRRLQ